MTYEREKRDKIRKDMNECLAMHKEAKEVKNRYRTLYVSLHDLYPNLFSNVSPDTMRVFLKDVVYADRLLRRLTEGEDEEEKEILSQEAQLELGYEPGYNKDIK